MPNETRQKVVVLGGEFGGVFTAKHLRRIAGEKVEIVLISRNIVFVLQPLLAEIAGGSINPSHGYVGNDDLRRLAMMAAPIARPTPRSDRVRVPQQT